MSIQVGPRAARQQAPAVGPVIVAGYDGSPASRAAIADAEQRAAIGHAVVEGEPAEGLMRVARARDAREIVVGSRGLGRLRAVMAASRTVCSSVRTGPSSSSRRWIADDERRRRARRRPRGRSAGLRGTCACRRGPRATTERSSGAPWTGCRRRCRPPRSLVMVDDRVARPRPGEVAGSCNLGGDRLASKRLQVRARSASGSRGPRRRLGR